MSLDILENALAGKGVIMSERQKKQFEEFRAMLLSRNRVTNLTAVDTTEGVEARHFADSLAALYEIDWKELRTNHTLPVTRRHETEPDREKRQDTGQAQIDARCPETERSSKKLDIKRKPERNHTENNSCQFGTKWIDLGCGAGFPGIPVKIMAPEINLTLIDSRKKRIDFVQKVIETLGLTGVRAVSGRFEDLARKAEYREAFDIAVSRAVAPLRVLVEYALPFLKTGGVFISYKSKQTENELTEAENALRVLGGSLVTEKTYLNSSPRGEQAVERKLVLIRKERNIPERYPRRSGLPSKRPL